MRQIKIFRLFWKNRNAPHKRKEEEALTSSSLYYAEDEGFKPPIPGKGYTGFRVQRIRSLCQSSFSTYKVLNIDVYGCKGNIIF